MIEANSRSGASSPGPVVALDSISVQYGKVQALDKVSLVVERGEVVALVGENGAGKSTLAKVLCGLVKPQAGNIRVEGASVEFASTTHAHRAGIRIVPQELLLCPNLSIAENIGLDELPRSSSGLLASSELRRVAQERLAALGLGHLDVRQRVGGLSVVQQTFVQIARGLAPGAKVLIMDEPTAPMSGPDVDKLLGVLQVVVESGVGLIYVSHRMDEVFRMADRAVVIRDGKNAADLSGTNLTRDRVITAMVGGRDVAAGTTVPVSPESRTALQVEGVSVPGVMHDVSFTLREGEILGIYGIAGSGRESIGAAIVGSKARTGLVRIFGNVLAENSVRHAVAQGVGYVPPERRTQGLWMAGSVRANLTLGVLRGLRRRHVLTGRSQERVARQWMERLAIDIPGPAVPMTALSGGNQQKVLIARWLAAGSRLLVLEEPTRGVDIATKSEIYRLLQSLAETGIATLVITSDVEEVALVSTRTLVMRKGRLAAELYQASQEEIAAAAIRDEPMEAAS